MKLTDEEKMHIARSIIEDGMTTAEMRMLFHLDKETVNYYVSVARLHGYEALRGKMKAPSVDRDFKLNVVHYYHESRDSMRNVAIKFGLNKSSVRSWIMEYMEKGEDAFSVETRGRKLKGSKPRGRKPKAMDANAPVNAEIVKENDQLKKRIAYLEMENEFLKKLDALVLERVEREGKR